MPIVPPWLRQTVALLFGPGRTFTLAVLVVAAFSGGAWAVWRHVEKHVENSRDYLVSVEQITITPPPEWVRSDVRAEAFRTASPPDRPLSSLDDGLAQRICMAFLLHPWVAKATVTKRAGRRVNVDIVYRRPVCMVEVANGSGGRSAARRWRRRLASRRGLFAEAEGVVPLPGGHRSPADSARGTSLGRCAGRRRRVDCRGALARLAATQALSHSGGVRRLPSPPGRGRRSQTYELYTRAGTRIVWGVQAGAPPRANRRRKTRLPGSCSMRPPMEVSTPDRRWMSAGFRRREQRSNKRRTEFIPLQTD